jgi:hypothetical protein
MEMIKILSNIKLLHNSNAMKEMSALLDAVCTTPGNSVSLCREAALLNQSNPKSILFS